MERYVIRELATKAHEYIISLYPVQFNTLFTKVLDQESIAHYLC